MIEALVFLWLITIGVAFYAGYRWGSAVKAKVVSEAKEITDKVKDGISDAADSIKKKVE